MKRFILLLLLAAITIFAGPLRALADPKNDAAEKPKTRAPETIAILDFAANTPGDPELGKQVSEVLAATLSGEDGFTLVDRASMSHTLAEHELNLTGLVSPEQTVKIGKLVGAKILITGKIFLVDKQLYLTAKLVGTETSILDGFIIKGDKDAGIGELMTQLGQKVAEHVRKEGPRLLASPDTMDDPLPGLKKALAGHKLPKIAVNILERHITTTPMTRLDPAAETEIRMVLKDAGFTIFEGDEKAQAENGVALVVSGAAVSEFAARIANLISCSGRLEIKITDRKTGEVLYSDRETTRGVDLAENIAAKSALQKAGHIVAIRILRHFEQTFANGKGADESKKKKPQAGE